MYLNETKIIGNVGNEPVTAAEGKKPFATFDVYVNKQFKKGDETVKQPHKHRVKCFGKLAEIATKLIGKGDRVFVDGELLNDEPWTDKDGVVHQGYFILADKVFLLDKKNSSQATAEE